MYFPSVSILPPDMATPRLHVDLDTQCRTDVA